MTSLGTISLRWPSTQASPTQPPRLAAPSETNPSPALPAGRPALRGTALTRAGAVRIPLQPRPLLWAIRHNAAEPLTFELALATGQHQPASRRRVLPSAAPRLPVRIPLESLGDRPQALIGPSPADCLDLESSTPAGASLEVNASVPLPRTVGEPMPLNLSCAAWDGLESTLQFRQNEPNGGGLFIPQIRTNTLRPSILFLPGPPGATPIAEASGRPPVISIADLRGSAGPVKERARFGAR